MNKWAKQKEKWSEIFTCLRCGVMYKEYTNVGRWECRYHPGKKVDSDPSHRVRGSACWVSVPLWRWTCCNRLWSETHENGCTPCDHSCAKFVYTHDDQITVPKGWCDVLYPRPEAVVPLDKERVNISRSQ